MDPGCAKVIRQPREINAAGYFLQIYSRFICLENPLPGHIIYLYKYDSFCIGLEVQCITGRVRVKDKIKRCVGRRRSYRSLRIIRVFQAGIPAAGTVGRPGCTGNRFIIVVGRLVINGGASALVAFPLRDQAACAATCFCTLVCTDIA
ncbi:MAG: hypothetical protein FD123_3897 [Bacteroidetes bacterium]|nr:MAG: hypothetical protein FD123_3897 [Bacteroidota bacterium]